jgi:hypothetical protein
VADSNRLAAVETLSSEHRKEINELKESTKFLSDEYEKIKLQIADLEASKKENVHLKKRVDNLENDLLQEKIGRNDEQQYLRQAFNVKVCGIPIQVGEDVQLKTASNPVTLEVLKQFALQTDILLPPSDIDVCHRLGSDADAPIIIRFDSKSARYKFVAQKEKLKDVTSANIDLSSIKVPKNIQEILDQRKKEGRSYSQAPRRGGYHNVARRDGKADASSAIYMQDHLTTRNKELLKEAKTALQQLFQFPGYVMDGQIRSKRTENEKFTVIRCSADIQKLALSKPSVPPKPK